MSNIFPRNSAKDRPFGMPEIDNGNVGEMLRQIGPYAESMNENDLRRKKDLMQFEFDLRNQGQNRNQPSMMERMSQANTLGTKPQGAVQIQAGPTPMQRMFQERDAQERNQKFRDEQSEQELSGKYRQAMDTQKIQDEASMQRMAAEIAGRKDITGMETGSRERVAADTRKYGSEEAGRASERRIAEERAQAIARGEQDRLTQANKPVPPVAAKDLDEAQASRIQQMMLNNPQLGRYVTKNENGMFEISRNAPPEAIAAIKQHLTPQAQSQGVITQKNKKTGQTRTSTDGGKTWTTK